MYCVVYITRVVYIRALDSNSFRYVHKGFKRNSGGAFYSSPEASLQYVRPNIED